MSSHLSVSVKRIILFRSVKVPPVLSCRDFAEPPNQCCRDPCFLGQVEDPSEELLVGINLVKLDLVMTVNNDAIPFNFDGWLLVFFHGVRWVKPNGGLKPCSGGPRLGQRNSVFFFYAKIIDGYLFR